MAIRKQLEREARLIGMENVEILQGKTAAIAGLGAVGGYALEMIARSGVGRIIIADFDTFKESNLNRQLLALDSTIGMLKTDAAAERIRSINPDCIVESFPAVISKENAESIFSSADIIIDCIDSVSAKADLLEYAYKSGIAAVSSMGAALRKEIRHIKTADIMDTYGCTLAKAIRSELRRRGVGRGIECVFSDERISFAFRDPATDDEAESIPGGSRKRAVLGSLATVTAAFGITLAELALKKLLPGVLESDSVR